MSADTTDPCRDPYREWDSAYVLGALTVDERLEFERHLESCAACSGGVGDLAGIPGILGNLDVGDALAVRDQDEAENAGGTTVHELDEARVLRGLARQERTRHRRRIVAFAASCVLFAGLGAGAAAALGATAGSSTGGSAGSSTGGQAQHAAPAALAMKPVGSSGMRAAISVAGKSWGTRLEWSCSYGGHSWQGGSAAKEAYELVVTDKSGKQSVVATWKAAGSSAKHLAASSKSTLDQIRSVNIRMAGSHQPLAERAL
jgi:hypothetical protein